MQSLTDQFKAFVRSKPADEEYDYTSNDNCALSQFLRAAGYPVRTVGGSEWFDTLGSSHEIPLVLRAEMFGGRSILVAQPWTFGALASRLEAAS